MLAKSSEIVDYNTMYSVNRKPVVVRTLLGEIVAESKVTQLPWSDLRDDEKAGHILNHFGVGEEAYQRIGTALSQLLWSETTSLPEDARKVMGKLYAPAHTEDMQIKDRFTGDRRSLFFHTEFLASQGVTIDELEAIQPVVVAPL